MDYNVGLIPKDVLKKFFEPWDDPELIEEVQAGIDTISGSTTTPAKVAEGTVPAGYDSVVMGIAVEQDEDVTAWVKRAEKQVYANGLNSSGLAGLTRENALFTKLKEKQKWEFGFTNTAVGDKAVSWRIRVRHIKQEE